MVASLDGSVSVGGTSGGLGNANDREVLLTLRRSAEVVLVGAGTAHGEGYGPPGTPGLRIAVATNSGRVDLDRPLFTSGAGFLLAPHAAPVDESRAEVLRAGDVRLDLVAAIGRLHEVVPAVAFVLAEGGPQLNGALVTADLVDELALTISPRIVGGAGPRLVTGIDELERRLEPAHVLIDDDGFLFTRWQRR